MSPRLTDIGLGRFLLHSQLSFQFHLCYICTFVSVHIMFLRVSKTLHALLLLRLDPGGKGSG